MSSICPYSVAPGFSVAGVDAMNSSIYSLRNDFHSAASAYEPYSGYGYSYD